MKERVNVYETTKPSMSVVTVSVGYNQRVNVREKPYSDSPIITTVKDGDSVDREYGSDQNGFSRVRLTDGTYGYMVSKYLKEF